MMRMAKIPCRDTRIGSRVVCRWNRRYSVLRLRGDGRCAQINWPTSAVPESLSSTSKSEERGEERGRGGREGEEGREEGGRRDVDRREKERREGGRRRRVAASRIQRIGTSPH